MRYHGKRRKYFTPTMEEVQKLGGAALLRALPELSRQYVGLMLPKGRWIEMRWGQPFPPQGIKGGGFGHGSVQYSPETGRFRNLYIHSGK
jgi:hypothetical protein